MKTLIKIVIAVAVLNAVVQAAQVAWTYYRFRDGSQQLVTFGSRVPTDELHN
jgi:hypothetical protein